MVNGNVLEHFQLQTSYVEIVNPGAIKRQVKPGIGTRIAGAVERLANRPSLEFQVDLRIDGRIVPDWRVVYSSWVGSSPSTMVLQNTQEVQLGFSKKKEIRMATLNWPRPTAAYRDPEAAQVVALLNGDDQDKVLFSRDGARDIGYIYTLLADRMMWEETQAA